MKHHVVLLVDSVQIPGTFLTEEWNFNSRYENEIPYAHMEHGVKDFSVNELREFLAVEGFVKRVFTPPGPVSLDPETLKEIGGSASLVEIVLSGAAIISLYFFKANGLPKYRKIFTLDVPEE